MLNIESIYFNTVCALSEDGVPGHNEPEARNFGNSRVHNEYSV